MSHINGIINIDKPSGITSMDVVRKIRSASGVKKVGHGGTLDPNVTGVLPVSIGKASKVIKVMQESPKEYVCLMKHYSSQKEAKVLEMFEKFTGPIYQIPPFQAAVKRELRIRRIYEIEMLEHTSKKTLFRVLCEGGTYIRNLCEDIGSALGSGGVMEQLIRTKSGPFEI